MIEFLTHLFNLNLCALCLRPHSCLIWLLIVAVRQIWLSSQQIIQHPARWMELEKDLREKRRRYGRYWFRVSLFFLFAFWVSLYFLPGCIMCLKSCRSREVCHSKNILPTGTDRVVPNKTGWYHFQDCHKPLIASNNT